MVHGVDLRRHIKVVVLPLLVLCLFLPWLGLNVFWQREVMLILITALIVSGLNLSFGYAGELALGQAAMYAAGAYATAILVSHGVNDLLLSLAVSALVAAAMGLISGIPGLRLSSWSLAMLSFFLILLLPDVINIFSEQTGGAIGISGISAPTLFGTVISGRSYFVAVGVVTALWFVCFRNFVRSPHGISLRVLRRSPVLATSLGISTYRAKLTSYIGGAIPAGLAGCLFAYLETFIGPQDFTFDFAIAILAASILGGAESIYGPLFGAALLQLGPLKSSSFNQYGLIVYGVFLVAGGLLFAGGLSGLAGRAAQMIMGKARTEPITPELAVAAMNPDSALPIREGAELEVSAVTKSFGGLAALREVTIGVEAGKITAIVGPNGSGKTTLLNIICGYYRADGGQVVLGGEDISHNKPYQTARAGVSRTFQTPLIPDSLNCEEVVRSALYRQPYVGAVRTVLRSPAYRRKAAADRRQAVEALEVVGLASAAETAAASLPLGTRRLLEIGRCLASLPRVLLLDEPASGLDASEVDALANLLVQFRDRGVTIVLVEHNFAMVRSIADWVHVLDLGSVVASGPPDEIAEDRRVAEIYLGGGPSTAEASAPLAETTS